MVKFKKWITCFFTLVILACSVFVLGVPSNNNVANAANNGSDKCKFTEEENGNGIEPYAIVSLSISLKGDNGNVVATVRNDFTLISSTVYVIVQLYSSNTYQEAYADMDLVSMNSIGDLDIYKTISTSASTGGEQKYWNGRMRYKINNGDWKEKSTGTVLYDGEGNIIR